MKSKLKTLSKIRKTLVHELWKRYLNEIPHAKAIFDFISLANKNINNIILDYFAIIDLPSQNSGIPVLRQIFSALGFIIQGSDYLPEKQNAFQWMVEETADENLAVEVLPQVVLADFRLEELSLSIRKIVEKYIRQIKPCPLTYSDIENYIRKLQQGDEAAGDELLSLLISYFNMREWALPSLADLKAVQEANELLAWVLLFGRKPNHFTISVHLLPNYRDLRDFHDKLPATLHCSLNNQGNIFKGSPELGIVQSSTMGELKEVQLIDGTAVIRDSFMEFIWRYPKTNSTSPNLWRDFHTGFIAGNANQVVESLYQ